jgi:HSP20 family protein
MSERYFLPRTFANANDLNPFSQGGLIDRMFDASFPWKMLKAFNQDFAKEEPMNFLPKLDVKSDAQQYVLSAEIPGVAKDNVKLEVHDGVLVLSGEKNEEKSEGEEKKQQVHVLERRYGSFERSMTLPEDADVEHIKAQHKDGVLTVIIPRKAAQQNKKVISINAE